MNFVFIILVTLILSVKYSYSQITPYRVIQGESTVFNIRFHPDSETIIFADFNGTHFFNYLTSEHIKTIKGTGDVLEFNSNFSSMITGYKLGKTRLWETNSGEVLHVFEGHSETIGSGRNVYDTLILWLGISDNEEYLVTVANDQLAILWNLKTKTLIHKFAYADLDVFENTGEIIPTGFKIGPATFSPDNTLIAFNHSFWNRQSFQKEFEFDDDTSSIGFIAFSDSGKYFMSNAKGSINVWDWDTKELIYQNDVDGDSEGIFNLDTSPDDRYIVGGSSDENVYIIDLETENVITINTNLSDSRFFYHPVQFHPSGDYFAVGGGDGKVLIYDFQEVIASQSTVDDWVIYE